MKILIVNSFYYPNMVGGTEHSVKLLAEGLANKGHTVSVFTIDNFKTKGVNKEIINGISIYRCFGGMFDVAVRLNMKKNIIKKVINKFVELNNHYVCNQFEKIIIENKPDIIHVNNIYGISPSILRIARKNNIKIVYTIRDYWILDPSVENKNRNNIILKLYRNYFRKYCNNVDYVTAPSRFTLEILLKSNYFINAKSAVVPNCVDIDTNCLNKILARRLKYNSNKVNFIYVGMLEEKKGILNLLNAFIMIENKNISLTICGRGKLENIIKEYCINDKRIKYLGQLSKENLSNEWLESDVAIVPSIWDEPFGRVVIEANQYGLPVIGSNRGGIKEIIENIKTGELFQYNNLEDLRKKINYYSDRKNIKKYYSNILNNISYYSLDNQISMFEEKYIELLKK